MTTEERLNRIEELLANCITGRAEALESLTALRATIAEMETAAIAKYIDDHGVTCDCCQHVMIDVTSAQTGEKQHCVAGDPEGEGSGCAHSFHGEVVPKLQAQIAEMERKQGSPWREYMSSDAARDEKAAEEAGSPSALELAVRFHETYERLAPNFGYETRKETRAFDPGSPNGRLMVAVCGELGNPAAPSAPSSEAANRESDAALPEIPCCPPHEAMWRNGATKPLDNCFVCIRNQRDELLVQLRECVEWMKVLSLPGNCANRGKKFRAVLDCTRRAEAALPNPQSPGDEAK